MSNPFRRRNTIHEWEWITGITVLDPDGFDRKDPNLYERLFTHQEFKEGLIRSTIQMPHHSMKE